MKEKLKKISEIFKLIFGYSIMLTLFVGGLSTLGYVAALIIGGSAAEAICAFIYKKLFTVLIYVASVTVLFGLVAMYLGGEYALTNEKKKK